MQARLQEIRDRAKKATTEIYNLANGSRKFTMSIPPQSDDSDLAIIVSLEDIPDLLGDLQQARDRERVLQVALRNIKDQIKIIANLSKGFEPINHYALAQATKYVGIAIDEALRREELKC